MRGWQLPTYPLPADRQDVVIQRVVVRHGVSRDLADLLIEDLKRHVEYLDRLPAPLPASTTGEGFKH